MRFALVQLLLLRAPVTPNIRPLRPRYAGKDYPVKASGRIPFDKCFDVGDLAMAATKKCGAPQVLVWWGWGEGWSRGGASAEQ